MKCRKIEKQNCIHKLIEKGGDQVRKRSGSVSAQSQATNGAMIYSGRN
jgi:hypothetical protein